jgi:hypothetical protein
MPSVLPRIRRLIADRRGASAVMFSASILGVFGAFALATDAGVWYSNQRGAQNAADSAASAGVMVMAMAGANQARLTAFDVSGRNGFTHTATGPTTVRVNIPPSSGPQAADTSAVEVIVSQVQPMTAAGLLLSTPPTVSGRSVARLRAAGNVCILALTGQLLAGGNTAVSAPSCVLASNQRYGSSIDIVGNSISVNAYTLSAVAACEDCGNGNVVLGTRYREWQAPVRDPYARLNTKTLPRATNGCLNRGSGNRVNLRPFENNGQKVFCGDIRINGGETTDLDPGTYFIWEGSLFALGGGSLTCSRCEAGQGVTIVFTGGDLSKIGGPVLSANSGVRLQAPLNPADLDWRGILFYRDYRAPTNMNNPSVQLTGASDTALIGGMYFPSSHVRVTGTADMAACSVIVAASIEFSGNSGVTNCAAYGTAVPQAQIVVVQE